MAVSVAEN